jgi:hypothetical protein
MARSQKETIIAVYEGPDNLDNKAKLMPTHNNEALQNAV